MLEHDIIVIGASAGGIEALRRLVGQFPPDLPAAVFVVVHVPPYATSRLPEVLSAAGPVPAAHAEDGEPIQSGHIYVAPPNHHLLVEDSKVRLSLGVRINRTRPAVDPLFLSAAQAYGPRVIGVVLSGTLEDGTVGLMEVQRRGGLTVAQDPQEALFSGMPESAIARIAVDHILPASEIGVVLTDLVSTNLERTNLVQRVHSPSQDQNKSRSVEYKSGTETMVGRMPPAPEVVEQDISAQESNARDGMLSIFTCPECGGALWQADAGTLIRFRCHTGHTMSGDSLFVGQAENVEKSLWHAARSLRDKARLARQLANNMRQRGSEAAAVHFEAKAEADDLHADTLERMIESNAAVNLPSL